MHDLLFLVFFPKRKLAKKKKEKRCLWLYCLASNLAPVGKNPHYGTLHAVLHASLISKMTLTHIMKET